MTSQGIHEFQNLERARSNPLLPVVPVDTTALIAQVREELFPDLCAGAINCWFIPATHLGFITLQNPAIYLHALLNRPDAPEQVFRHIVIHELIHLVIPGREIGRKYVSHPPEFWDMETSLSQERSLVINWICQNFWDVLKVDKKNEGFRVRRQWRSSFDMPLLSLDDVASGAPVKRGDLPRSVRPLEWL